MKHLLTALAILTVIGSASPALAATKYVSKKSSQTHVIKRNIIKKDVVKKSKKIDKKKRISIPRTFKKK